MSGRRVLGIGWLGVAGMLLIAGGFGCGTSDGGAGIIPDDKATVDFTLAATTKQVTAESEATVLSVEDGGATIVLEAGSTLANSLAAGDVLLFGVTSRTPDGLLRKVVSTTDTAQGVMVTTGAATLPEAFETLDLKVQRSLPYTDMKTYEAALEGLEIVQSPLSFEGSAGNEYQVGFDGTVIYDADGDAATTHDQVIANGSISFSLGLTLEVETSYLSLKRLKIGTAVVQDAELTLTTNLPALDFDREIVVADLIFGAFVVGPVVITPNLELVLGANGELEAELTASVTEAVEVTAGADFDGVAWDPSSDFKADFGFQPPTLTASARLRAFVGPRVKLLIYGVAGPRVQVNGFLELEAEYDDELSWELHAGLEAFIGIEGEIFGHELVDYTSGDVIDYSTLLAESGGGECQPQCEGKDCGPNGCGGTCGYCGPGDICDQGHCGPYLGTYYDSVSGLTWQNFSNEGYMPFSQAVAYCDTLEHEGDGWRLPTIGELRSLIRGCPATQAGGTCNIEEGVCLSWSCRDKSCGGCPDHEGPGGEFGFYWPPELIGGGGWYWSTTKPTSGTGDVWYVDFGSGAVPVAFNLDSNFSVRCVR